MSGSIEVHAITGSMIAVPDGPRRLISIRRESVSETVVFLVSPVCEARFELASLLEMACHRDERLWSVMEAKTVAWNALAEERLPQGKRSSVQDEVKRGFGEVEEILRTVWLIGDISVGARRFFDAIVGRWAALMLHHAFELQGLSVTDEEYETLMDRAPDSMLPSGTVIAIGACHELDTSGERAAAGLAARFNAACLTYWNDDELVTTADMEDVPGAQVIDRISYAEATELSFFGAHVIHPMNMVQAVAARIPIRLRSFADFKHPGTLVDESGGGPDSKPVKGFSVVHSIALVNVEGAGMIGVPGIAQRLFAAMREAGISVVLISQASSEYSICFAVPAEQAAYARATARSAFSPEIADKRIHRVEVETGCAILAAVGDRMPGTPGIAGTFFGALGKAHVNVRAIAQGSSERNISAVIKDEDSRRALRALHAGFFLSNQALSVGLFGPGNIGATLLDQIAVEAKRLNSQFGVDIRIRAIANSTRMLLDEQGIELVNWRKAFATEAVPLDLKAMVKHVGASYFPHAVLIDCTTSASLPSHYPEWIERGIHVITPNKKAGTAPYEQYKRLMAASRAYGKHFLYETTVGAGLPIIGTLKDMIKTGDRIKRIEGIVSGTLAYLFASYDGTVPFSTLLKEAKEKGYTEPDPRDDLSGMDVARKTVILAREIGFSVEVGDIQVLSLVPEELRDVPLAEFIQRSTLLDEPMMRLYREARAHDQVLRYVGTVESDGSCHVELGLYDADHAFARAKGTDNVVAFTTDRYRNQPLVIRGPGAGPEVTAGGVFADLLRLSAYLGARLS